MNKIKIRKYQIFSTIFVFFLGTLLHFVYDWSGQNQIIGVFSAVNESTWEHLKLIYFPVLITIIMGYLYLGKTIPNFVCSKTIGLLISLVFTVIFFYTYTGVLGTNIAFIDIFSFFIAVILGEFLSYVLIVNNFKCNNKIAIIILSILYILFMAFTYNPPRIGLFKEPVTGEYGIIKNYTK